jgi:DNA polymerase III delta subunit
MEVNEIKHHIQSKQFNSFYIFSGTEWKVQKIYIDMIAKTSQKELRYIDNVSDLYTKSGNKSFIQKNYTYVVRDDKELMQNENLQKNLNSIIGNNILILLLTTLDKRLKFYKTYKDSIVEFESLKSQILKKYIQQEINLSDMNCEKLMEVCEYDYGRCLLEIDKIKCYEGNTNFSNSDTTFKFLLEDGVIYTPPKDAIFDFVDSVLDAKVNLAYNLYHQCLAVDEATMVMLSVLYNNTKAVLQVQSCESSDVEKSTGLTKYQIMGARKHLNVFSIRELINIMKLCQECQQGIVTGTIDEEYVMDYILTSIL